MVGWELMIYEHIFAGEPLLFFGKVFWGVVWHLVWLMDDEALGFFALWGDDKNSCLDRWQFCL